MQPQLVITNSKHNTDVLETIEENNRKNMVLEAQRQSVRSS